LNTKEKLISSIKKRYHFYPINAIIFICALIWALWIILIPYYFPPGTIDNLDGRSNAVDNSNVTDSMPLIAKIPYYVGDMNCHQKHNRSFYTNGNQQPFCARCTAIFVGLAIGAFFCTFLRFDIRWYWLILGLVPIGLDGGIQLFANGPIPTHYESTNLLRLITGIIAGITTMFGVAILTYDIDETREREKKMKEQSKPPYYVGNDTNTAKMLLENIEKNIEKPNANEPNNTETNKENKIEVKQDCS